MIVSVFLCMFAAAAASGEDDVFKEAKWLRDPVFKDVNIIPIAHRQNEPKPELSGPRNVHTLFRREVTLSERPVSASLWVTADDYCKLYINGAFVVQGPEPAYPFMHPYYELPVTDLLKPGTNCLAAHVYYQGLLNRVWNSADNRSGFMLRLDLVFADGRTERLVSDESWRCLPLDAFTGDRTMGYETQFAEDIDMLRVPVGWRETGFDDSSWVFPLNGLQDHVFRKQITPPLEVYRVDPVIVKNKGDGNYFYDFGGETVGCTRIRIRGEAGHRIEVRHGEELAGEDTVRYEMRANCVYQEFVTLSGGDDLIEFYDYRAFRYVEIMHAPGKPEIWVDARHHPFDSAACTFRSSDELLNAIWDLCKNSVRWGSQGVFVDCPSREKGQYLGDTLIAAQAHLTLTGDWSLTRKALTDYQASQRICPGIMAVAPGSYMQEFTEYSLHWPMLLERYYQATGDAAFTRLMAESAFQDLFAYFEQYENADGLLTGGAGKPILVDWPPNLRYDFDFDYAKERENAVVNAFYYASLHAAADVMADVGMDAKPIEAKAQRVADAFVKHLLNPETGLFLDAPGSQSSSLHANALALAFGLAPAESAPKIVELIRQRRLQCGVYIAPFVIEAAYRGGAPDLAYDLLTGRDENSWHEMLRHGATTCIEVWQPEQKRNASWCHAWGSSPIFLIAQRVIGLTPAEPGWRRVRFEPHWPASLERAEFTMPTPRGPVSVIYEAGKGYIVTVPPGVPCETAVPDGISVEVRETALDAKQRTALLDLGWESRVGKGSGIWVSIPEQMLRVVKDGALLWQAPCSTASAGAGADLDSGKTPPGWHVVQKKIGESAPWGQVFRSRLPNGEKWRPGDRTSEDLVLSRVLHLAGAEPGKNQGGAVDSFTRCIYIHGTNCEEQIGRPVSHGCIRLRNDDVIALFAMIPEGTPVLITDAI